MGSRRRGQTFADMVREVADRPRPEPEAADEPAGWLLGSQLTAPDGATFRRVVGALTPTQARLLGLAGATLLHDPCGCGGGCGVVVVSPDDVARAANVAPPTIGRSKNRWGVVTQWTADDGQVVLLAENFVSWGDLLD